jgi:hypothetical protein
MVTVLEQGYSESAFSKEAHKAAKSGSDFSLSGMFDSAAELFKQFLRK